ncbi:MAG: hypothetical protein AB1324_00030 [Candidatus Micrarchaeota archaeon]
MARISDKAVKEKTGKGWEQWFSLLDKAGAAKMPHSEIASLLHGKFKCPEWWSQMVANTYEQARGLRKKHEMPDGYQISASKTVSIPLSRLYKAFADPGKRQKWLDGDFEITTARKDKSIRAKWQGGKTSIDISFYGKGSGKSEARLGHNKLPDAKAAEKMKAFWKKALEELARTA